MTKMIPPVPTSAVIMPTPKQKIGFSIASIVGNDGGNNGGSPAVTAAGHTNNHSENNNNNNENHNNSNNNNSSNTSTTSNGPSSPPQTPPTIAVGSTHLPLSHHYATHPHMSQHHQLSAAQQHALHQHLLLQHHQQQQQQQLQQQLQQHQQQQHQQHLEASSKSMNGSPARQPPHDIQDIIQRLHNSANAAVAAATLSAASSATYSPPPTDHRTTHQTRLLTSSPVPTGEPIMHLKRERSPVSASTEQAQNPAQRHQPPHTPPKSVSPLSSPPMMHSGSPAAPQHYPKPGTMMMPGMSPAGLVRPFPMGPGGPPPQQGMPDIKALPPYINAPPELPPQHNPHLIAAAQFQMAAALQAGHVLGPAAAAAAAAGLPPHSPFMPNPGMPRDSYPLYPWLLSRHGRIFPHRFPGNFLLQPFRKPKRIRTAFSPSQLLKLEHAFESNQYVVGAERKALAQSLNLSETQVKVWFQNRRTKHKRMQQEDEKGGCSERNSQGASCDEDDDELIDMEMDDCPSDEEHELDASH